MNNGFLKISWKTIFYMCYHFYLLSHVTFGVTLPLSDFYFWHDRPLTHLKRLLCFKMKLIAYSSDIGYVLFFFLVNFPRRKKSITDKWHNNIV